MAETPALLGLAGGDTSPPGIGTMRFGRYRPALRITPAGRYEAHLGTNLAGHRILWVDYEAALSLHAVVTGNAKERRLERLATASILDNRISYGCINVPARSSRSSSCRCSRRPTAWSTSSRTTGDPSAQLIPSN